MRGDGDVHNKWKLLVLRFHEFIVTMELISSFFAKRVLQSKPEPVPLMWIRTSCDQLSCCSLLGAAHAAKALPEASVSAPWRQLLYGLSVQHRTFYPDLRCTRAALWHDARCDRQVGFSVALVGPCSGLNRWFDVPERRFLNGLIRRRIKLNFAIHRCARILISTLSRPAGMFYPLNTLTLLIIALAIISGRPVIANLPPCCRAGHLRVREAQVGRR